MASHRSPPLLEITPRHADEGPISCHSRMAPAGDALKGCWRSTDRRSVDNGRAARRSSRRRLFRLIVAVPPAQCRSVAPPDEAQCVAAPPNSLSPAVQNAAPTFLSWDVRNAACWLGLHVGSCSCICTCIVCVFHRSLAQTIAVANRAKKADA